MAENLPKKAKLDDNFVSSEEEEPRLYNVERVSETRNRKFGMEEVKFRAKFTDHLEGQKLTDISDALYDMFDEILENISQEEYSDQDKVRIAISHAGLQNPVYFHAAPRHAIDSQKILDRFEAVLQSNQSLPVDSSFELDVGIMKTVNHFGGGKNSVPIVFTDADASRATIFSKKSLVAIPVIEGENICCARAIVVALSKKRDEPAVFYKIRDQRNAQKLEKGSQKYRALQLHEAVGLPTDKPVFVKDIVKFECHLSVDIVVVSDELQIIYKGSGENHEKIFLYLRDNHFHAITKIESFFPGKKFCIDCLEIFTEKHSCGFTCPTCKRKNCKIVGKGLSCGECNMFCRSKECHTSHKQPGTFKRGPRKDEEKPSLCDTFHRCPECGKILDLTRRKMSSHRCLEYLCRCCGIYVLPGHLCHYRIKSPAAGPKKFIFFDFEATQDTLMTCEKGYKNKPQRGCTGCFTDQLCASCRRCKNCNKPWCGLREHRASFLVAQTTCDNCKADPFNPDSKCRFCGQTCEKCASADARGRPRPACNDSTCGLREFVASGPDTTEMFCRWLLKRHPQPTVAVAHSGRSYDFLFLVRYFVEHKIYPEVIYTGAKIMTMSLKQFSLRFVDSLNFLPMALKKLPAALNLASTLKKGDFPHFLNTQANWNYKGPYPDPHYYGIDRLSSTEREEFLEWHAAQEGKIFDFQEEILAYTRSDCSILREASMKFRALIMSVTKLDGVENGLCPFAHATLASSAMQMIRQLFLWEEHKVTLTDGQTITAFLKRGTFKTKCGEIIPEETIKNSIFVKSPIPQIPAKGYAPQFNDSKIALLWLEWVSRTRNIHIRHSRNGSGEFHIPGTSYYADGYWDEGKTVFSFEGCFFHGCPNCYPNRDARNPRTQLSFREIFKRSNDRLQKIRELGFKVESIWECEFRRQIAENEELATFAAQFEEPPSPLHIRSAFFGGRTSPAKLFYEAGDDEEIRYLDVTSLYPFINFTGKFGSAHPVIHKNDFDLSLESYFGIVKCQILPPRDLYIPVLPLKCRSRLKFPLCARCAEEEKNRLCMCSDDQRALTGTWATEEVKVALKSGYRILKIFEVYHFPETVQGPDCYFHEYVSTFLKIKQEASGFPSWVKTEEDKESYVKNYYEKQGILLEKEKIVKNPSLRFLSKLYLNSAWGKFGQAPNKTKCLFLSDRAEYVRLCNDPSKEIVNFHIINDDVIVVELKSADDFMEENKFENETIAILTTAQARLHLFKILEKTNRKTLYFDTDSVLYIQRKDEPEILETGDLLGDLTSELPEGVHIKTFMSSGPKSYCYIRSDGERVMKIKGLTLNHLNSSVLTSEKMRDVVLGDLQSVVLPSTNQIARDKLRGILYNRPLAKKFRKVFTKRAMLPDSFDSVPYGFHPYQ